VISWLLDNPTGIAILTVVASTVVGAATWAALTAALLAVAAVVRAVRFLWRGRSPSRTDAPGSGGGTT
jgi:hypothetical protein